MGLVPLLLENSIYADVLYAKIRGVKAKNKGNNMGSENSNTNGNKNG